MLFEPSLRVLALPAAAAYATFHAWHKVALFLAAGAAPGSGGRGVAAAGGFLLALLAASYAGLPGLAGYAVKAGFKDLWGAFPAPWPALLPPVLAAGGLLTLLLAVRAAVGLAGGTDPALRPHPVTLGVWAASALMAVVWPFTVEGAGWDAGVDPYQGLVLTAAAVLLLAWRLRPLPLTLSIPPGDLLHAFLRWAGRRPARLTRWPELVEDRLAGPWGGLAAMLLLLLFLALIWSGRG
jgi:hypothetical protein